MNMLLILKEIPTIFNLLWKVIQFVESRGSSTNDKQREALNILHNTLQKHKAFISQFDGLSPEIKQVILVSLLDYTIFLLNEILGHDWANHLNVQSIPWKEFEESLKVEVK